MQNNLALSSRIMTLMMGAMLLLSILTLTSCSFIGMNSETTIQVYFSKMSGNTIKTEAVKRQVKKGKNKIAYAVEQLLQGPNDDELDLGYYSEIPQMTKLINIIDDPMQVRVNLSKDFISGGGANSITMRLKELTDTLLNVEKDRPVYIDVEGEQLEILGGEGQEVPEPLTKDLNSKKS